MAPYHDRMPVLIAEADIEAWLSGDATPRMLRPAAEAALREWIVSQRVNKTGFGDDDPTLLDPVDRVA